MTLFFVPDSTNMELSSNDNGDGSENDKKAIGLD